MGRNLEGDRPEKQPEKQEKGSRNLINDAYDTLSEKTGKDVVDGKHKTTEKLPDLNPKALYEGKAVKTDRGSSVANPETDVFSQPSSSDKVEDYHDQAGKMTTAKVHKDANGRVTGVEHGAARDGHDKGFKQFSYDEAGQLKAVTMNDNELWEKQGDKWHITKLSADGKITEWDSKMTVAVDSTGNLMWKLNDGAHAGHLRKVTPDGQYSDIFADTTKRMESDSKVTEDAANERMLARSLQRADDFVNGDFEHPMNSLKNLAESLKGASSQELELTAKAIAKRLKGKNVKLEPTTQEVEDPNNTGQKVQVLNGFKLSFGQEEVLIDNQGRVSMKSNNGLLMAGGILGLFRGNLEMVDQATRNVVSKSLIDNVFNKKEAKPTEQEDANTQPENQGT